MPWPANVKPHIQIESFREPGFLPVCNPDCGGGIDTERLVHLEYPVTRSEGKGTDRRLVEETIAFDGKAGHLFAAARNAFLKLKRTGRPNERSEDQPFLDAVPDEIRIPALWCASKIAARECPVFYVGEGAIRTRRSTSAVDGTLL